MGFFGPKMLKFGRCWLFSDFKIWSLCLQDQLSTLKLEEYLGSAPVQDIQDPSGAAKQKLLKQIQQLKTPGSGAGPKTSTTDNVGKGEDVFYELLMKPDSSKLEERQKLALFESRLEALEKALGPNPDKMVSNEKDSYFFGMFLLSLVFVGLPVIFFFV